MTKIIRTKKGLNINLKGKAEKVLADASAPKSVSLKPTDFRGLMPKMALKEQESVQAGGVVFFDKFNPEVKFTSPLSGKVVEIIRGEKRKILEVVIETDGASNQVDFGAQDTAGLGKDEAVNKLKASGTWPLIKQRPYNVIADSDKKPKAIYVSTFDTAPLAPDFDFIISGQQDAFQAGINVLKAIGDGCEVVLNNHAESASSGVFNSTAGVTKHLFNGPHPVGNVGTQIAQLSPINKGETVWTVGVQELLIIGRLFLTGKYDASRIVALTGSQVKNPKYYKTIGNGSIAGIISGNIDGDNNRFIGGNVLTGTNIGETGHLGYFDSQISVIPEGDFYEFFGWALPGFSKYSFSRLYFSWLSPKKEYVIDTNFHGGERAFVITGQYEKVMPMDIYVMQLIKAIMVKDIDLMEKLGIYEVVEEDLALPEFICTSKTEMQEILGEGIDLMIKELG